MDKKASVVITTKNRKIDLKKAIDSVYLQTVPVDLIVMDDGSTDGTEELIKNNYKNLRYFKFEKSEGYIVQRNRAASLAACEMIFSIDDDAEFSTPFIIEDTLQSFKIRKNIGAVGIPFVNVNQNNEKHQFVKNYSPGKKYLLSSFVGTAYAIKKKIFMEIGGFRKSYFHQGEEEDLCIRLYNVGYEVIIGNSDPIYHYESPIRDYQRLDHYGRRNNILFAWYNVPNPYLFIHLFGTTLNGILHGFRVKRPFIMLKGLIHGYLSILSNYSERKPVNKDVYKNWKKLKSKTV